MEYLTQKFTCSLSTQPYKYEVVPSCDAVKSRYQHFMWTSMTFHLFVFIFGIVASALAGNYKSAVGVSYESNMYEIA